MEPSKAGYRIGTIKSINKSRKTKLANDDLHEFIGFLCGRLAWTPEKAIKEFEQMKGDKKK